MKQIKITRILDIDWEELPTGDRSVFIRWNDEPETYWHYLMTKADLDAFLNSDAPLPEEASDSVWNPDWRDREKLDPEKMQPEAHYDLFLTAYPPEIKLEVAAGRLPYAESYMMWRPSNWMENFPREYELGWTSDADGLMLDRNGKLITKRIAFEVIAEEDEINSVIEKVNPVEDTMILDDENPYRVVISLEVGPDDYRRLWTLPYVDRIEKLRERLGITEGEIIDLSTDCGHDHNGHHHH